MKTRVAINDYNDGIVLREEDLKSISLDTSDGSKQTGMWNIYQTIPNYHRSNSTS